jgi:hypothetical protein
MVALDGERAVYSWKDGNSRGFGEAPVAHRGDLLFVDLRGVSLLLEPLPGNAFQITYERQGQKSVTHLNPIGPQ